MKHSHELQKDLEKRENILKAYKAAYRQSLIDCDMRASYDAIAGIQRLESSIKQIKEEINPKSLLDFYIELEFIPNFTDFIETEPNLKIYTPKQLYKILADFERHAFRVKADH